MAETYEIVSQTPVTASNVDGTFGPAMEVRFTTKPHNVPGVVRVPMTQYTPANVDNIVAANAATLEAVQQL